jgi:hypothetical protein
LKAINNVPSWHFLSQNFAPFGRRSLSRRFAKGRNAPALNRALRRRRLPGLRFRKHRFYRDSVAQLAPGEGIARQPGYSGRPRSSPRPIQSNPAHSRSLYPNGSRSPGVPILSVRELYRREFVRSPRIQAIRHRAMTSSMRCGRYRRTSLLWHMKEKRPTYSDAFDLVHRREAERPNAIWQADHTLLDILVQRESENPAQPPLAHCKRRCSDRSLRVTV